MAQLTEEQKMAGILAGQIHSELAGTVGNQKISPREVLSKMGIDVNPAIRRVPQPQARIQGMVEAPRNTPQAPEIAGVVPVNEQMPELIPIPADLQPFANEYIKETTPAPTVMPIPMPIEIPPGTVVITEPAPTLPVDNIMVDVIAYLERIETLIKKIVPPTSNSGKNKSKSKYSKNSKGVLLNEKHIKGHSAPKFSESDSSKSESETSDIIAGTD